MLAWAYDFLPEHFHGSPAGFHEELNDLVQNHDRLAVAAPRAHAKSTLLSLAYPLYRAAVHREPYILIVSDNADQASEHVGNIFRELLENAHLIEVYPHLQLPEAEHYRSHHVKRTANDFITVGGLKFTGKGAGSSLRGKKHGHQRPSLIVVDDLENDENVNTPEQRNKLTKWFLKSLSNLPGAEGGQIIVIGTILHHDSLLARLVTGKLGGPTWARRTYKAIDATTGAALWPGVWTLERLEAKRADIGSLSFSSEFLNEPLDEATALFKRAWLKYGLPPPGARVTMGVDLALSLREGADYTAIITVAQFQGEVWVLDAVRVRATPSEVMRVIIAQAAKHRPSVINIESIQYQAMLVQQLQHETRLPVRGVRPDKDKVTRAAPLAVRFEQGLVHLAPGLPGWFEEELLMFPAAPHDDAVDALVYAWNGGRSGVASAAPGTP